MDERSFHTRSLLCPKEIANQDEPPDDFPPLPKNIHIMEQTNQLNVSLFPRVSATADE